jgi:RNA 2',3'-cyclic 3'-phosphodiesterase
VRLFAAVNFPEAEKKRLGAVLEELRRSLLPFRFVQPDSLHLTLKFFGEVTEQSRNEITLAIRHAVTEVQPFIMSINGFGTFPPSGRSRVLWVGIEESTSLQQLQENLEQKFERIGFAREQRGFHPHITLARATSTSRGIDRREVDRITGEVVYNAVVPVESVDLMRSHLSARGAQYERLEQILLGS